MQEKDQEQNALVSSEQQADLRRLQMGANEPDNALSELEAAEAAQADAEAAAAADQNGAAVRMGLDVAIPFLSRLYPSLAEIYTDEARGAVAATVGPVLTKYGIDLGDVGGRYKEEIALVLVCGPIAMATYQGINRDVAAREKAAPKAMRQEPAKTAPEAVETVVLG
jgi:hypothetical protein